MAFTSSTTNLNNTFHVGPKGQEGSLLIVVEENLLFSIRQQTVLRVPAIPVDQFSTLNTKDPKVSASTKVSAELLFQAVSINCERVLYLTRREDNNLLWKSVDDKTKEVISCSVKNITLIEKLIPLSLDQQSLAIAIYNYTAEIKYVDALNRVYTTNVNSGTRYQRIILPSSTGRLQVDLDLKCVFTKFYPGFPPISKPLSSPVLPPPGAASHPPNSAETQPESELKPARLWLRSTVLGRQDIT
ncbi:MAG: hypothetical protein ACOX3R_10325 [Desulfitobacteriia bacterium]|jgi:hypothetical protein